MPWAFVTPQPQRQPRTDGLGVGGQDGGLGAHGEARGHLRKRKSEYKSVSHCAKDSLAAVAEHLHSYMTNCKALRAYLARLQGHDLHALLVALLQSHADGLVAVHVHVAAAKRTQDQELHKRGDK